MKEKRARGKGGGEKLRKSDGRRGGRVDVDACCSREWMDAEREAG